MAGPGWTAVTGHPGRHEHGVLVAVLVGRRAEQVSRAGLLTHGQRGPEYITPVGVKCRQRAAADQEWLVVTRVAGPGQRGERPAGTVHDAAEQPGPQLDAQRPSGPGGRVAGPQPGRRLVDLGQRHVAGQPDNLAGQLLLTYLHQVEQPGLTQTGDADHRPGHPHDCAPVGGGAGLRAVLAAGQRERSEFLDAHGALPSGSKVSS